MSIETLVDIIESEAALYAYAKRLEVSFQSLVGAVGALEAGGKHE